MRERAGELYLEFSGPATTLRNAGNPTEAELHDETLILAPEIPAEIAARIDYRSAGDALVDPRGRTVRCTPWRRTIELSLPGGRRLFRKIRTRRPREAVTEWRLLRELGAMGYRVPSPLFLARDGAATVIGMLDVPGRPMDALLTEAARRGLTARESSYLCEVVAPLVRRLHEQGLYYRDLYWNHLFTPALDAEAGPPSMIDVERVFRPRLGRRRWVVKDLAGLLSSWPPPGTWPDRGLALRFLRSYGGKPAGALARAVLAKARRIRAHSPKYG